jgi:FdhD protein
VNRPPASRSRTIERVDLAAGTRLADRDPVVLEAPLVLRARGAEAAVVMRTPGDDLALVRGLLHGEGVAGAAELALRQVEPDVVDADLAPGALPARALAASAACGLCGQAAIATLERRVGAVEADWQIDAAAIAGLPAALRAGQTTFDATGGLHAAALFARDGALVALREDVGRHNAVDKLVGWGLVAGVRFVDHVLVLSGRLGYELAAKAAVAGIPVIAAVSAPSTLAVDVCERFGVTACGFVRDQRLNVYAHGWRIV